MCGATRCLVYGIHPARWLVLISELAPALEAILPYSDVQFNGTLDYPSPFRGKGPSVDAAWETIVNEETSMTSCEIMSQS